MAEAARASARPSQSGICGAVTGIGDVSASRHASRRQYFQYGYWRFRSLERHPDSFSVRWMAPPALVVVLGAGLVSSRSRRGRLLLASTGAAYVGGLSVAALALRRAADAPTIARLPLAFATMHLAWGAGFLTSDVTRAAARLRERRTTGDACASGVARATGAAPSDANSHAL